LPKKLKKALFGGKSEGMFISDAEVEEAKNWYYAMAGWNVMNGNPTREKLHELGLEWIADQLDFSDE
jgi:aldehyde:ferredoxin oxidoreductase